MTSRAFPDATRIRLVLGFSPGSMSDQIARTLAPALAQRLDKSVDIDLLPGNNGADAACEVATAEPNGTTLFVATLGTHALAPHLDENLPYDPLEHFSAVALVSSGPLVLACHASLGVSTPRELIELAASKPRTLTYGTSAVGGGPHLAAELFQALSGIEMQHVRYDETERLYRDLAAGRISMSFNNIMSMLPRCTPGELTALAVTSARRSAIAEHLPTIAESGIPGYEVSNWTGIVAPKGTPATVVDELSAAISAALQNEALQRTFRSAGVSAVGSTPAAFTDFIEAELRRWGPVVARFRGTDAVRAPTD